MPLNNRAGNNGFKVEYKGEKIVELMDMNDSLLITMPSEVTLLDIQGTSKDYWPPSASKPVNSWSYRLTFANNPFLSLFYDI